MDSFVVLIADIFESILGLPKTKMQEWESRDSIIFLKDTIENLGYKCKILEPKLSSQSFLKTLMVRNQFPKRNTILFNLVEGFTSRNREGYIPALSEFLGFPHTGSDAYAQNISLDKHLTKQLAKGLGIPTPKSYRINGNASMEDMDLSYPLFIKPNAEGSSLGIFEDSIVENSISLKKKVKDLLKVYNVLLVEEYLPGVDLTLGIIGNQKDYKVSKAASIYYPNSKVYGEPVKGKGEMSERLEFDLQLETEKKLQTHSISLCEYLGVSSYARVDWRCDEFGNPYFLEINLTPGLSHKYSSFPICYQKSFGSYSDMVKEILELAIEEYIDHARFDYGKINEY